MTDGSLGRVGDNVGAIAIAVAGLGSVCAACSVAAFQCDDDADCVGGGGGGQCEAAGVCSFPDEACASGRRFGKLSGTLANECVPEDDPAGTAGESSSGLTLTPITEPGSSDGTTPDPSTTDTSTSTSTSDTGGSSSSTGDVLDPDLIAWYTFESDAGGTIADATPNGLDGTCAATQCPTTVPGPVGMAAHFDGVDDLIYVADDPLLRPETGLSVALWIRLDSFLEMGARSAFNKPFGPDTAQSWEVLLAHANNPTADQVRWTVVGDAGATGLAWLSTVAAGEWFHMAGTWDGVTTVLYVNGEVANDGQDQDSVKWDDNPMLIGGDVESGIEDLFLDGALDDVRLYGRGLTAEEVQSLFALGTPP